ncbi:MAG TPA: ABC transporter permease [Steroidobacteraceae bacterium]|nr:ABC transporter permease [Steroidobacteraceae bacterium]
MIARGVPRGPGLDPLGVVACAIGAVALATLPFVLFKANRILPGEPRAIADVLPATLAWGFHALLALVAVVALRARNAHLRLVVMLAGLAATAMVVAVAASALTPDGNRVVRAAPGGGAWVLVILLGLLATDALTRLQLGPLARVACMVAFLVAVVAALSSGYFDDLSIMREYANNAARFADEARRHAALAIGSLLAALIVGVPTGVACHRAPRLRAAVLGALQVVQTVPSIALFGILMAPLGALVAAWPALASAGVSGIGAAPAAVALFLYALLPVVANTVVGLARVPESAVDAARGLGFTPLQVLREVELPLALPTMLAGVRIALVQNVGLVTIAALVGGGGFGTFVFQGIGQTAMDLVLLGALPTVAFAYSAAVVLEALVERSQRVPR